MEGSEETLSRAWALWEQLLGHFIAWAPRLVGVLLVLLLGWLAAVLVRRVVRWAVQRTGLEALAERAGVARLLYGLGVRRSSAEVAGQLGYWSVMLLVLHTVTTLLGIPGVSHVVEAVAAYMPRVLVAAGIFTAGLLGADVLRRLVSAMLTRRKEVESPHLIARGVHGLVILLAGVVAVEQLGVDIDLITSIIQILLGAAALGLALAFGLGAREILRDLVARFYVTRLYRPGDRVEVVGVQGTIVAFSPTATLLRDGDEERVIPCHTLLAGPVTLHRTLRADEESIDEEGSASDEP